MGLTFILHVADRPGVLNRIAALIHRRGYNIESLTVGPPEEEGTSRITLVLEGDVAAAGRITANLYKVVHVHRVEHVTGLALVSRTLALIKIAATSESRTQIMQIVDVFRARVVDAAPESLVIEITGGADKIDGLVEMLEPFGVLEIARTGPVAMVRGVARQPAASTTRTTTRETDDSLACSV